MLAAFTGHATGTRQTGRMALVAVAGLFLAGCGSLGSYEVAPGEFVVHGDGAYADAALVQKEAQKACPSGFTKKSEEMTRGTADFRGGPLWHIVCNPK